MDIYQFPKRKLAAKSKKEEYTLAWARAIWSFDELGTNSYINGGLKEYFKELRRYGASNQDPARYRDLYTTLDEETRKRKGYTNVNEEIFAYASKLKNGVIKLLTGNGNKIDLSLINQDINNEKSLKKAKAVAFAKNMPQLQALKEQTGAPVQPPDFIPNELTDLDAYEEAGGFKLNPEISLETALEYVFENENNWERTIGMDLKEDFIDIGVTGVMVYIDAASQTVKYRLIDPENTIVDKSSYIDFRDAEFFGEVIPVSVNDFIVAYEAEGKSIPEDEVNALVEASEINSDVNYSYTGDVNTWYDSPKTGGKLDNGSNELRVLDFVYLSIDVINKPAKTKEISVNIKDARKSELESGKIYERDGKYYKKIKVGKKIDVPQWRRGKWVVNTDIVYDFGLVYDQVRDDDYSPIAPFVLERLRVKPIMKVVKPNLDNLQIDMLKLQIFKANAAPAGLAVDVGSITNVTLGADIYNPKDILKLRKMQGTYFYKLHKAGVPGQFSGSQAAPFHEIEGGMGRAFNELLMDIDLQLKLMQDNTGLSDIALAQQPSSQMGLGLNQMSLTASENIISNIYFGYKSIKERVANITALHILQLAKNNPNHNIYSKALGKNKWEQLTIKNIYSIKSIGAKLRDLPKGDEIQFMNQLIMQSLQIGRNGTPALTPDEAFMLIDMIKDGKPMKWVNLIFKRLREQREEKAQAMAEKNIQMQGQQNMQAQQAAAEASMQQKMQELQASMKEMQTEFDLKLRNAIEEKQLDIQETQMELQSKEKIAYHNDLNQRYLDREKKLNLNNNKK